MMALTDLTGTVWTLKDSLVSYAGGSYSLKSYAVNITTSEPLESVAGGNAKSSFTEVSIGYDSGSENNIVTLDSGSYPFYMLASGTDTKSLPDTWTSKFTGTFTITGGTDATNSALIAWMESNCDSATPASPAVTVSYEGENIVEMSNGGTKTLKTQGKYLTDDIALTYVPSGGGGGTANTCTMTIEGSDYVEVTCSNFSSGAPSGTFAAIAAVEGYFGDSISLLIFVGADGVTSFSDSVDRSLNAAFFVSDYATPGPFGTVFVPLACAYANSDFEGGGGYSTDDWGEVSSIVASYVGTHTAKVIEF